MFKITHAIISDLISARYPKYTRHIGKEQVAEWGTQLNGRILSYS